MTGKRIGEVIHFFDRISVAVIQVTGTLKVGDNVHILGRGSDYMQEITSMQIEHEPIEVAKKGDEVAIKVTKPVKPQAAVYLLKEE